jgi:hypothetical protein
MEEIINEYRILVGKPGRKREGRPRCRWEDDIRMNLAKYGGEVWSGCIWIKIGTSGGGLL